MEVLDLSPKTKSFLASLRGPVDPATYDRDAGWRWVSWGPWGRAERFLKLVAYSLGTLGPILLYLEGLWDFSPPYEATPLMRVAGWLMLVVLTPLQVLDIRDRWLMRDYLSNLISIPRTLSHPLIGLMLLYGSSQPGLDRVVVVFSSLLLVALFFEGVFLRKHLGREHRVPGRIPRVVFWVFLYGYVGIYVVVLAAGLLSSPSPQGAFKVPASQTADSIYTNARVFTADDSLPWAEALAVQGNRFVYVGDGQGSRRYQGDNTRVHDLEGRLILPGLIDAHTHPGYIGLTSIQLQLPMAETRESLYQSIQAMVRDNPGQESLIAMPWSNDLFGPQGPHKRDLDALEPDRPVLIWDDWMHGLWVNSKALEVAGLDGSVVDPIPGFSYYQRDDSGELTGYITESAATDFWTRFVEFSPESKEVLLEYLLDLRRSGVTTVFDAGNFGLDEEVYGAVQALDEAGELPVRYHGSYTLFLPQDADQAAAKLSAMRDRFSGGNLQVDTLKLFLDGVIETRTAYMIDEYLDTPGNRGNVLLDPSGIKKLILDLEEEGLHLHVHTVGNLATRSVLDAMEAAQRELGRDLTIRIALSHLEVMSEVDAARFEELGVIAQFTPHWHGGSDDGSYDHSIGDLQERMYLTKSLVDDGAVVSFSSDAYFTSDWEAGNASPFVGIEVGHTRQYVGGGADSPRARPASEALSREAMVRGYTRGGAYQLGVEDQLGSIEPGKRADFIVLDEDLFGIDPYSIHRIKPSAIFLDGRAVAGGLSPRAD